MRVWEILFWQLILLRELDKGGELEGKVCENYVLTADLVRGIG